MIVTANVHRSESSIAKAYPLSVLCERTPLPGMPSCQKKALKSHISEIWVVFRIWITGSSCVALVRRIAKGVLWSSQILSTTA